MNETIRVDGGREAMEALKRFSEEFPKRTVSAGIRNAMKPFTRAVEGSVPSRHFKGMARAKIIRKGNREPIVMAGVFSNRKVILRQPKGVTDGKPGRPEGYMSTYMVFYWVNYGTLARRNPGYAFRNARRFKSSWWKGGIESTMTVEQAWARSGNQTVKAIPEEIGKAAERYLKRLRIND